MWRFVCGYTNGALNIHRTNANRQAEVTGTAIRPAPAVTGDDKSSIRRVTQISAVLPHGKRRPEKPREPSPGRSELRRQANDRSPGTDAATSPKALQGRPSRSHVGAGLLTAPLSRPQVSTSPLDETFGRPVSHGQETISQLATSTPAALQAARQSCATADPGFRPPSADSSLGCTPSALQAAAQSSLPGHLQLTPQSADMPVLQAPSLPGTDWTALAPSSARCTSGRSPPPATISAANATSALTSAVNGIPIVPQ